jgi:hypothetical protein
MGASCSLKTHFQRRRKQANKETRLEGFLPTTPEGTEKWSAGFQTSAVKKSLKALVTQESSQIPSPSGPPFPAGCFFVDYT